MRWRSPKPFPIRATLSDTNKKFPRPLFSITYSHPTPKPRNPSSILKLGRTRPTLETLMATLRQIEANRRNAQKSTGPTSVAGKAASSMNALKSVVTN
jgi:hypothetical protein